MQILLTETEYKSLIPKEEVGNRNRAIKRMRELLIKNNCIHSVGGPVYCSGCKLSDIGGKRDENRPNHVDSKLMCDLPRNYPQ